jgi:hypothetical protein
MCLVLTAHIEFVCHPCFMLHTCCCQEGGVKATPCAITPPHIQPKLACNMQQVLEAPPSQRYEANKALLRRVDHADLHKARHPTVCTASSLHNEQLCISLPACLLFLTLPLHADHHKAWCAQCAAHSSLNKEQICSYFKPFCSCRRCGGTQQCSRSQQRCASVSAAQSVMQYIGSNQIPHREEHGCYPRSCEQNAFAYAQDACGTLRHWPILEPALCRRRDTATAIPCLHHKHVWLHENRRLIMACHNAQCSRQPSRLPTISHKPSMLHTCGCC